MRCRGRGCFPEARIAAGGRLRVPVLAVPALELVARTSRSHVRRVTFAALAAVLACGLAVIDAAAQTATVTLTLGRTTLAENAGATSISVTAELSATESTATVVTLTLAGTANGGTDYEVVGTIPSISIPAGQTTASGTLHLRPTSDSFWEGDESIEVQGTASNSATVQSATLTLADDDARPGITINYFGDSSNRVIREDTVQATTLRIHAQLSSGSGTLERDTEITLSIAQDSIAVLGQDFTLSDSSPTITIEAGSTVGFVDLDITPVDDSL